MLLIQFCLLWREFFDIQSDTCHFTGIHLYSHKEQEKCKIMNTTGYRTFLSVYITE
jgi:hypothetical protein